MLEADARTESRLQEIETLKYSSSLLGATLLSILPGALAEAFHACKLLWLDNLPGLWPMTTDQPEGRLTSQMITDRLSSWVLNLAVCFRTWKFWAKRGYYSATLSPKRYAFYASAARRLVAVVLFTWALKDDRTEEIAIYGVALELL